MSISSQDQGELLVEKARTKPLPDYVRRHSDFFKIAIFEGIGTLILTYAICCSQYVPPIRDKVPNVFYKFFVACAFFLSLCWSASLTGGHLNPAVTLGTMIRTPKLSKRTASMYIVSQIAGAFFGSLLAWAFFDAVAGPYNNGNVSFSNLFLDFIGEIIGTFMFVFFVLMITTPETTFVQDKFWVYMFISLLLYTCKTFSFRVGGLNPAVAFAIMIFKAIDIRNGIVIAYSLVLIIGPLVGGLLAGLFFEKVYKRIYLDWKEVTELDPDE